MIPPPTRIERRELKLGVLVSRCARNHELVTLVIESERAHGLLHLLWIASTSIGNECRVFVVHRSLLWLVLLIGSMARRNLREYRDVFAQSTPKGTRWVLTIMHGETTVRRVPLPKARR